MSPQRPTRSIAGVALVCAALPVIGVMGRDVAQAGAGASGRIAYIAGNAKPPTGDRPLTGRLASMGYDVTMIDDDELTPTSLNGADLVMVSSSVEPAKMPAWLGDSAVPMLVAEAYVFDDYRLATNPNDVRSAKFDGGVPLVSAPVALSVGIPADSADVHGWIGNKSGWFSYEAGDALVTGVSPARRTGLFVGYEAGSRLTEAGWNAFDEAVAWTITGADVVPTPPVVSPPPTTLPAATTTVPPATTTLPPATTTLPPSRTTLSPATTTPVSVVTSPPTTIPAASTPASECGTPTGNIHQVDFEDHSVGAYPVSLMKGDWSTRWEFGVAEGRVSVVRRGSCKAIRVAYPAGQVGPRTNGASWTHNFEGVHDEVFLRYDVKFGQNFDFRAGGKLPGLFGGERNTGGHRPDGTDGFSARIVWQEGGQMTTYLYHPEQERKWGDHFYWTGSQTTAAEPHPSGSVIRFVPGRWYTVEQRVKMNTPGRHDGVLEQWVDGQLATRVVGLMFRTDRSFGIDGMYFNTFFGGQSDSYRTAKNETVDFDNFVISTRRIGTATGA